MAMMTLTLMTTLMMTLTITGVHAESILRTNYGFPLETLKAQVHFSTDNGRIVLYYTITKTITAVKVPYNIVKRMKYLIIRVYSRTRKHI